MAELFKSSTSAKILNANYASNFELRCDSVNSRKSEIHILIKLGGRFVE